AVQVDENTVIYVETTETSEVPEVTHAVETEDSESRRGGAKGWNEFGNQAATQVAKSFEQIQTTIQTYTKYTLNAFRDAALADVKQVTLEFGVNLSGMGGVPYIASGTMECNMKITVECAFPERQPQPMVQSAAAGAMPRSPQSSAPSQPPSQARPTQTQAQPIPLRQPPANSANGVPRSPNS
ncbi:MAG TPA: CU044_2847 family protein, partial [Allocoleopsis sp.]